MKKTKLFLYLAILMMFLTACGKEPLQEMNYEDFRDTINANDFTGFAYAISDESAKDSGYIDELEKVFEEENSELIYLDEMKLDDETYEKLNDESRNPDLYLPHNEIYIIKNGKKINEIDIDDNIFSKDGKNEIAHFIDNFKE